MSEQLRLILEKVSSTADFSDVDLSDVNTTNRMGDNALHCVAVWGDIESAKLLLDVGIEINRFGERGYTPLHIACMFGHIELVKLLVSRGADLFAQSEGDLPFATARLNEHDSICDYLSPLMKAVVETNKKAYIFSRIEQLKREIQNLEQIANS